MAMERSVKGLLGGGLKPNDPRRFLIEAMIGAMNADGAVDARETAAVERQITNHPLFQGLAGNAARTLIELSNDAIRFAGSAIGRVPAIAKGLPARIHRLAAFGMAAEVAVADLQLADGEREFLEALRIALRIAPLESEALIESAKVGRLTDHLEDRYQRIRSLVPVAAEVFALRAVGRAGTSDEHRFRIRDFFTAMPDLVLATDELDGVLYQAFRKPRAPNAQVLGDLSRVAATLPDPVDRYWMTVYTLVAEPPATVPSWRVIPFTGVVQLAFQIVDADIALATVDALTFPAALPRPM
jgi:uncharacterized tellurite resistance protein B-like protein